MAAPYLADLEALVGTCVGEEADEIVCQHFFSGAAAYLGDKILATLSPVGLAFKLSESSCAVHLEADAVPLRYFPNAPVKRNYVLFGKVDGLGDDRIAVLMAESIQHARSAS